MSTIPIEEIERHVSRYLSQVEAGEKLVITRGGKPIAEITPVVPAAPEAGDKGPAPPDSGLRPIGLAEGLFLEAPDFDEPYILLPEVTDPEERARILAAMIDRMQKNPIPPDAPPLTREALHERH